MSWTEGENIITSLGVNSSGQAVDMRWSLQSNSAPWWLRHTTAPCADSSSTQEKPPQGATDDIKLNQIPELELILG